jgi:hypothetical protein
LALFHYFINFFTKFQIRFLPPGSPGADRRDIAALLPIIQSDEPMVLRNAVTDEQLSLRVSIAPFKEPACLPAGEANGQVAVLGITRVRGASATVP